MRRASPPFTPIQSPPTSASPGRRCTGGSPPDRLAELSGRFARFRREHPRGARVPGDLRAAVLAALREGVTPSDLYRACGISWGQVAAWRAAGHPAAKPVESEVSSVRVFNVVDEPRHEGTTTGCDLELRLGPWSVSVRLADEGLVGRR